MWLWKNRRVGWEDDCEPGLALMQGRGVSCTVPERTLLTA